MRGVVEESQARAGRITEIHDVQRRRFLVETVTITARIKTEKGAEQKPNGGLVRNDQDFLAGTLTDQFNQGRQCPRRYGQSTLPSLRGKGVGVVFPGRSLFRESLFHFVAESSVPSGHGRFHEIHRESALRADAARPGWRRSRECGLTATRKSRRKAHQRALGQPTRLLPAFVGKRHIRFAGETIFRAEHGRAVPNHKNARSTVCSHQNLLANPVEHAKISRQCAATAATTESPPASATRKKGRQWWRRGSSILRAEDSADVRQGYGNQHVGRVLDGEEAAFLDFIASAMF